MDDGAGHKAPFIGGLGAILLAFLTAGFSFLGTEMVGVAAGESEDPHKNVPRAIRSVFWRILIFYIGAIVVISFLNPFNKPNLLRTSAEEVAYSPFTMIFARAGIAGAASIMNAVILTSLLSCANSSLYVSTRMLYSMAEEGKAPTILSLVVIFGANYWVFQADVFSWFDFVSSYGTIILFIALYLGFKFKYKTKMVPLKECDFSFNLDKKVETGSK